MYMKRTLLTFGILAVAMLLSCVASAKNIAGYPTVDGWAYTVYDDGTAELTSAPGATGAVVIPETITYEGNTYTVTRLGFSLFDSNVNITAIQLPSGLKELGGRALAWCTNLETVTGGPEELENISQYNFVDSKWMANQPDGPVYFKKWLIGCNGTYSEDVFAMPEGTIGMMMFGKYKGIQSKVFRIPASVAYIPANTLTDFYNGLQYLERFEVDEANKFFFNDEVGAIYSKNRLAQAHGVDYTGISFDALPIANPVKVYNVLPGTKIISTDALNTNGMEQFNVPEGVEYIGHNVFRTSPPKNIDLPSTIKEMNACFYSAKQTETVVLRAATVPAYTYTLFDFCSHITLYVPDASVDAYKAVAEFARVKQILPMSQYLAVKDITGGETSAEVTAIYGIDGSVRTALQPGINIVRYSDGTARKVMHRE